MTAAAKKRPAPEVKKPPEDLVEVFDCDQRSEEWYALRAGLCTASNFGAVMAEGRDGDESKMRNRLLYRLAAEIDMKRSLETYSNHHMQRGVEMEAEALEHYAFTRGVEVKRVGFVRRTISLLAGQLVVGCSPDGLVGEDGIVQIKTMLPDLLIELVDRGRFPSEFRAQVQGELWVTGRVWADIKIFYSGLSVSPVFRLVRDDAYILRLAQEVEKFDWELRRLVERVRARS